MIVIYRSFLHLKHMLLHVIFLN